MKRVAIVQSNYLPWKGYFDLIASVDQFVVLDNVQYTKRDWRNRNKIKTPGGPKWITVPVKSKGKFEQLISDVEIEGIDWVREHSNALETSYRKTPFFDSVMGVVQPLYDRNHTKLSDLNIELLHTITRLLGIKTEILRASDLPVRSVRSQRLLDICCYLGAGVYLSGPAARSYLDLDLFKSSGLVVEWMQYGDYPEYAQPWGKFIHEVTILDLLFCCGPSSLEKIRMKDISKAGSVSEFSPS